MQCYQIKPTKQYCYGSAIVAARTVEEAIQTYCKQEYNSFLYDDCLCTTNLVYGLDFDTKESCIVIDNLFSD